MGELHLPWRWHFGTGFRETYVHHPLQHIPRGDVILVPGSEKLVYTSLSLIDANPFQDLDAVTQPKMGTRVFPGK